MNFIPGIHDQIITGNYLAGHEFGHGAIYLFCVVLA